MATLQEIKKALSYGGVNALPSNILKQIGAQCVRVDEQQQYIKYEFVFENMNYILINHLNYLGESAYYTLVSVDFEKCLQCLLLVGTFIETIKLLLKEV